jgi:hypothetical protein
MEPELGQLLQSSNKQQLILLVQDLLRRHPDLLAEMTTILQQLEAAEKEFLLPLRREEEGEDKDDIQPYDTLSHTTLPPIDLDAYRERVAGYVQRITQKKALQTIHDDIMDLLKEAERRAFHHEYATALSLYALILDERLSERNAALTALFDQAIDEAMPALQELISEASSSIVLDTSSALVPLLGEEMRRAWIERLFALWLKRLDTQRLEQDIPDLMLDLVWNDDIVLLRHVIQEELQRLRQGNNSNIVDFTRQYRSRALERFLKELPLA